MSATRRQVLGRLIGSTVGVGLAGRAVAEGEMSPTLKHLGTLVGGSWLPRAEGGDKPFGRVRYQWAPDKAALHGRGWVGGSPVEALFGWDPQAKKTYYLDLHGAETVFFGSVELRGEDTHWEFRDLVGAQTEWVIRESFSGSDRFSAEMSSKNPDPAKRQMVKLQFERSQEETDPIEVSRKPAAAPEPHELLKPLAALVGGSWQTPGKFPDGRPIAELRYEWAVPGKQLRAQGRVGDQYAISWIGLDTARKAPYYVDVHGSGSVFFGHYHPADGGVRLAFRSIVGTPGEWETTSRFAEPDRLEMKMCTVVDGKVDRTKPREIVLVRQS